MRVAPAMQPPAKAGRGGGASAGAGEGVKQTHRSVGAQEGASARGSAGAEVDIIDNIICKIMYDIMFLKL